MAPSEKVASLLKKREDKLKSKNDKKKNNGLTPEDKEIAKKVKSKKKENKRQRARETDDFDQLMDSYKSKLMKSLDSVAK